ncbi:MAG: PstS family phosphate ABC transporter substrate-binding protein [Magnetococcales bacterium]|nr:PstS family phosphate ABC transporter substrate-binding protein [Magnetococcales bacterium]
MKGKSVLLAALSGLLLVGQSASAETLIKNRGSDTMMQLAQAWADAFHKARPEVTLDVRSCGSVTGIVGLINGTADIANTSRLMNKKELEEAKSHGVNPKEHLVGYDALAIFVHKSNPVEFLSIKSLADIYGEGGFIDSWSKVGVTVPGCRENKIHLIGRSLTSGTNAYFHDAILGGKLHFRHDENSIDLTESDEILALVAKEPCAIGYIGMGYGTPEVKKLKISQGAGSSVVEANIANAINQRYPLARPLFMYTDGEPTGAIKAYLEWVQSDAGQCLLLKTGYAPIRHVECKEAGS